MTKKNWKSFKTLPSPRLIPEWKDLKSIINDILNEREFQEDIRQVTVLSDRHQILYQESYHLQKKICVCFYSLDTNYFIALNWLEQYEKQMHAMLWIQEKNVEKKKTVKKVKFSMMAEVPPIKSMVYASSHSLLIAYCEDMRLRLFGDHRQAFAILSTVPCRFSISCLCYDSETGVLFSGTSGVVVTWFILVNGKGLRMAQRVTVSGRELVQDLSLDTSLGFLIALCESVVRFFTQEGQGQLREVKTFTSPTSGSSLTCSCICVSQNTFYAGNKNGEIHAWDIDKSKFLHSFKAHSSPVICVHSRPETYTLFTAGREGLLREWNLASGNLLRQLSVGTDLQQLRFLDDSTFFCQTVSTFSLHRLPHFYKLFNICGSAPQKVQRVLCGQNWTRILCATEDGLLRFLSPVTGDLLVVTWPLLAMDKAVAWAYHSEEEELYVAIGSSEVLVFDVTRSPCTAKYLVCTSENYKDKVKCLVYGRFLLGKSKKGLIFCGHESGVVRILSQYSSFRTENNIHSGSVLSLSTPEGFEENPLLCSYGKDNYINLTKVVSSGKDLSLQSVGKILCVYPLKHLVLLPGSVGAITERSCWVLWPYQDFLTSESRQNFMSREISCLHECAVTSFDVCMSMKLFVTGATDGSVRIWDFRGKLVTQLDSDLRFGSPCFANKRGDLLLTFNQSIYIVSCLDLLPLTRLMHLNSINLEDEIQETPKPFLPSFFFSFELIFVPKFVYPEQNFQELQGLDTLVNKRAIAFDGTVPHVVEEGRHISTTHERPGLYFVEEKYAETSDSVHPYTPAAQLQLPAWDGQNIYRMFQSFFGQGKEWPFAPDCYIPNSVIRARLWPDGTPVFLRYDLSLSHRDKDTGKDKGTPELLRSRSLSTEDLEDVEMLSRKRGDVYQEQKRESYGILESMTDKSWMGKKFSDGLVENLVETILNLTVYCSTEKYKKYFSALTHIFSNHQIPSKMRIETACRLLKDITHYNSSIRELAWEMLEKLGFISHVFTLPLTTGLMDSEKSVRTKVLYLMSRYTGIQTKSMLLHQLRRRDTLQELQQELIGDFSLSHLLRIQTTDMDSLISHVKDRLNEDLTLSHRGSSLRFSFDSMNLEELEVIAEQTFIPLSESEKIDGLKKRKKRVHEKTRKIVRKTLKVSKKSKKADLPKVPSVVSGEPRRPRKLFQGEIPAAFLLPELLLSSEQTKEKREAGPKDVKDTLEILGAVDRDVALKQRQTQLKKLLKETVKKEKAELKEGPSLVAVETPKKEKKEVLREPVLPPELEKDTMKKYEKLTHGLAGTPGRVSRSERKSWREDICSLLNARIASSHRDLEKDLGEELQNLAEVVLTDQPSWALFQDIVNPWKRVSQAMPSESEAVVQEPPVHKKKVAKKAIKERMRTTDEKDISFLKKQEALSPKDKQMMDFLDSLWIAEKKKLKAKGRKSGKQKRERVKDKKELIKLEEEERLIKPEKTKKGKRKLIPLTLDKETPTAPQKLLTTEDQKLLPEERGLTRKEKKQLRKEKKMKLKSTLPEETLTQDEEMHEATQEVLTTEDLELAPKEKKLHKSKKKTTPQKEMAALEKKSWDQQKESPGTRKRRKHRERKQEEEEEEVAGEEQVERRSIPPQEEKKESPGSDRTEAEEEVYGWELGTLDHYYSFPEEEETSHYYSFPEEEETSEEEIEETSARESSTEQEELLAQEKDGLMEEEREADRLVREEAEQQREERPEQGLEQGLEEEAEAEGKKQLAQEGERLDLREKKEFEKMKEVSKEVRPTSKRKRKIYPEKRRAWKKTKIIEEERRAFWEEGKARLVQEEEKEEEEEGGEEEEEEEGEEEEGEEEEGEEEEEEEEEGEEGEEEKERRRKQREAAKEAMWRAEKERLLFLRGQLSPEVEEEPVKMRPRVRERLMVVPEDKTTEKKLPVEKKKQAKKREVGVMKGERATKEKEKPVSREVSQIVKKESQFREEEKKESQFQEKEKKESQFQEKEKKESQFREKEKKESQFREEEKKESQFREKEKKESQFREEEKKESQFREEEKKESQFREEEKKESQFWEEEKKESQFREEEKKESHFREEEKKEEETERKKQLVLTEEKVMSLQEGPQASEAKSHFQEKKEEVILTSEDLGKRHTAQEKKAKARERMKPGKEKTEMTPKEEQIKKKQDTPVQGERKSPYSIRAKPWRVVKDKKKAKEETKPASKEQPVESRVFPKEMEADVKKNVGLKENKLLRDLARILREAGSMPAEERFPSMRIVGQGWEILKKQGLKPEEERKQARKERKRDAGRLTEEALLEDSKFLKKNQEKIFLDGAQVETLLTSLQEKQILGKSQLTELVKHVEERQLNKIQLKWLLDNVRHHLFQKWTEEKMEEGLTYPERAGVPKEEKEKESLEEEEEEGEAIPKKKKRRYLKGKVRLSVEGLQSLTEEQRKRRLLQKRRLAEKKKLSEEEEGRLIRGELGHVGEEEHRDHEKGIVSVEEGSLSEESLSEEGLSEEGLSEEGLSEEGLSEEGLSEEGLSEEGLSEEGLSEEGLSEEGLSEEGLREIRQREKRPSKESLREIRQREKRPSKESLREKRQREKRPSKESLRELILRGKSQREKSPSEKSLKEISMREKSHREKKLRGKSQWEESLREKSPSKEGLRGISLREISLRERSPSEESLREKRQREKRQKGKSPSVESLRGISLREKRQKEKSLREISLREKSPSEESLREKSPSKEGLREISLRKISLREKSLRKRSLREKSSSEEELSLSEEESVSEEEEEEEERKKEQKRRLKDKTLLKKEKSEAALFKPQTEAEEDLVEERESVPGWKMLFREQGLFDGARESRFMDKSHLVIPPQGPLGEKEEIFLRELKKRWDNRFLEVLPETSSRGRQETGILGKDRKNVLQGTGLETQLPEPLYRPQLDLHMTLQPQMPTSDKSSCLPLVDTKGRVVPPAPASSPEKFPGRYKSPAYEETSISEEGWVTDALGRLEAGEHLSRESFHRLHQLLRDFCSPRYWQGIQLSNLKAIVQHLDVHQADLSQPRKEVFSPQHLKVIPPIKRKERQQTPSSVAEPMVFSATQTQTPEALRWHLLAKAYREKQAGQIFSAVKDTGHLYPTRRGDLRAAYPYVDRDTLALMLKEFPDLRLEIPTFSMEKKTVPIPGPMSPSTLSRTRDSKAAHELLDEPHRSARMQQLSDVLKDIEMQRFYPARRDILTGTLASVDRQTLALMFQKELKALKRKGRYPKVAQVEKTKPVLKKEVLPSWETFVALYHVLRMLQQRYAKDMVTWMEKFYQLMDLYQLKSPRIQRLLQDLLLMRQVPQWSQEFVSQETLNAVQLVPGQRLFYRLFCGGSGIPAGSRKFRNVIPLSGQNNVDTVQHVGIAQYGFLELAWKSLPQVKPFLTKKLPPISPHTH
ncbi:WD repeat-containing protein 87-like [Sigmodon hispidus]